MDIIQIDEDPFKRNDGRIDLDFEFYQSLNMINKRLAIFLIKEENHYPYKYLIDLKNFQIISVILNNDNESNFSARIF